MQSKSTPEHPLEQENLVDSAMLKLYQLTQLNIQGNWQACLDDLPVEKGLNPQTWQTWSPRQLNAREHIDWPQGHLVLWLGQVISIPNDQFRYPLADCKLRLALTWWAEQAEIFVNGALVQAGDLYDCTARIVLSSAAQPGEEITVALRLVSPGHDPGALVGSQLIYEPPPPLLDPGKVADELAVLQGYLTKFAPEELASLNKAINAINWSHVNDPEAFSLSLNQLHQHLAPWKTWLQQRQINWIGHAHLDLAWLWPVAETWEAAERTFKSVLNLQADFPELIFCHSSPALYAWFEQNRPDLFAQIQAQVDKGTWEIAAGLWVESELNLISGESLVRQVLYGQKYTQEKFGCISKTAWLPDSFGFCWQLPQILKQGGIDYFLTQKLRWNDTTEFPYEVFQWRSPDGTEIFSIMLPPIGEQIYPVKMGTYAQGWESATGVKDCLWLPGVGDHGGGPTRDMLEVARQWQQSSLFPKLQPTTAERFCQQVETQIQQVPVWDDELYLELHRGCYTSHADQKHYNRDCEKLLYEAELWNAIATLTLDHSYPKDDLEQAWKKVLFNQFHDILPGSSIPQVFVDANCDWESAKQTATEHLHIALDAIASAIDIPQAPTSDSLPVIVFNSLNWPRSELVWVELPDTQKRWQISTIEGETQPVQRHPNQPNSLGFIAAVPSVGYQLYWLSPLVSAKPDQPDIAPKNWILENDYLQVQVNESTGELAQIYDKATQRQMLSGPGNQLQFFTDKGQYWDAWNIDPNYEHKRLPGATLQSIEWLSQGPLQQRLRVKLQFGQSQFCQDYVLDTDAPLLKIETTVDWQESQVLVKTVFPLTISSDSATYEIPCGAIQRPTLPNPQLDDREQAKWEVPALQWADLTDANGMAGVSILNDCKYGYDAKPDQLRLTLLRSPNWPDPGCDRGHHQFTYAIYPHAGSWQTARTTHKGYEINRPLRTLISLDQQKQGRLLQNQFLSLGTDNLVLMALKRSEDQPKAWVMRCYECHGEEAPLAVTNDLNLHFKQTIDLLETNYEMDRPNVVAPWKIRTLMFTSQ
ncbi:alpha-mannosidase [Acaryochloris marina]|uniref:Alpha-mannosidase n=1 Tax=Acaryochloris marina (strain MBIC 11017) TaxID=329726 RepID=B0C8R0_ACAM1|nr:glycoside hydrolase family 38 C-terminal domain-containing protein [Acaryochloris marina]ABW31322.1 alpha-mannosidase [Acaryochloris marina MBIC11017]